MNSQAYVYFAMESAMTKRNYEKYSKGSSIMSEECRDKYSNCFTLAKDCCHDKKTSNGLMSKDCCASCTFHDSSKVCKRKATCSDKYGNCVALTSARGCSGRSSTWGSGASRIDLSKDCCETCSPSSLGRLVTAA